MLVDFLELVYICLMLELEFWFLRRVSILKRFEIKWIVVREVLDLFLLLDFCIYF